MRTNILHEIQRLAILRGKYGDDRFIVARLRGAIERLKRQDTWALAVPERPRDHAGDFSTTT